MPIFEYRCKNAHITERFTKHADRPPHVYCEICGELAELIMSVAKFNYLRMGIDPTMGTAADKWAKMHTDRLQYERAHELPDT